MITGVSILILILSLIRLPFVFRVDAGADILNNQGYFRIRLFRLTVFKALLRFEREREYGSFVLEWKNKTLKIHLNADEEDEQSIINYVAPTLISALKIPRLAVEISVGKRDDALFTAFALSAARIVACSGLSVLKSKKGTSVYDRYIVRYNEDYFKIAVSGIFRINIADIIYETARIVLYNFRRKGGIKIDNRA